MSMFTGDIANISADNSIFNPAVHIAACCGGERPLCGDSGRPFTFHLVDDTALLGNVFGVPLIHNAAEWGEIILALVAVHAMRIAKALIGQMGGTLDISVLMRTIAQYRKKN